VGDGLPTHETPPIVLDTNVLVAGACRHAGSLAYRILLGVLREQVPLILTPSIALEYQDVLQRAGVLALTGLTHAQAVDLVTDLIALSRKVHVAFEWRPNLRDESDNKFVDAAVHAAATIVTYNIADYRDADLMRHGWEAMTPQEFLTRYPVEEVG
jgi:predicted nucleic acid-binding protein